jgi:hypothetical protein
LQTRYGSEVVSFDLAFVFEPCLSARPESSAATVSPSMSVHGTASDGADRSDFNGQTLGKRAT